MAQESVQGTIMYLSRPPRDFLSPVDAFNIRTKANGSRLGSRTNLYDETIPSSALSRYETLFHPRTIHILLEVIPPFPPPLLMMINRAPFPL
jgi:hypothetical protein